MELIVFLILISLGYTAGTVAEKRHYAFIRRREGQYLGLPVVTLGKAVPTGDFLRAGLVMGSAVISLDYFKRFLAGLRNIFGGEVGAYSSLVDRARREAVLRMVEAATGADMIVNLRIETSAIGQSADRRKSIGSIEAIAYGTALYRKKGAGEVHSEGDRG